MAFGRGYLVVACAITLLGVALLAPAHAQAGKRYTCGTPRHGTVLFFPPGAFIWPATDSQLRAACRGLGRAGFAVRTLPYPLRDVRGALGFARARAHAARRKRGPVYAYGESAGGTLAATLALEGRVDGAVAEAAPTNLVTWASEEVGYWRDALRMDRSERAAASPALIRGPGARPLLLLHSRSDQAVPHSQSLALARGRAEVRLVDLTGAHLADPRAHDLGLTWFRRLARRP